MESQNKLPLSVFHHTLHATLPSRFRHLEAGAGLSGERGPQRDLSDIARTWRGDPAFDSALAAQDTVDEGMWR